MTSYLPFSISAPPPAADDDAHLEITVVPSSSAFYAGETFSATIRLRNTRAPCSADSIHTLTRDALGAHTHAHAGSPMRRKGQVGLAIRSAPPVAREWTLADAQRSDSAQAGTSAALGKRGNGEGPSRPRPLALASPMPKELGFPYSPGANPSLRAGWPTQEATNPIRSPGWKRADQRELGHGRRARSLALTKGMSPQEMVWALGAQTPPPPLPTRRGNAIPPSHPHARKPSSSSTVFSPPPSSPLPLAPSPLDSIPERTVNRSPNGRIVSPAPLSTPSRSLSRTTSSVTSQSVDLSPRRSPASTSTPTASPARLHARTPSYQNAYGASFLEPLPPPVHPKLRKPTGSTKVLWAHSRLIARFAPSNTYIPPDPLLPLRSMLLHQPVGSGSLSAMPMDQQAKSRWQLSFGTGTIGSGTTPSLTGSLFGLAKDVVFGGQGGTLEEERKRVWNTKELPVLETARSLLAIDLELKEGESREFVYTFKIPTNLPPTFKGKAVRFTYDFVVSLSVALPGADRRQKSKDISVPIRVWANVSIPQPLRTYDILQPVIQTTDEARISASSPNPAARRGTHTLPSLEAYAWHLLDTLDVAPEPGGRVPSPRVPASPSRMHGNGLHEHGFDGSATPRALTLSASGPRARSLSVTSRTEERRGYVDGDDELVEDGARCGEVVEVLSRHSPKMSYDIAKDGELVAVLTLVKTIYRLGETVLGVVTFNAPTSSRRVLRFSAYLESYERIPEPLLPWSASSAGRARHPHLSRLHAEHRASFCPQTARLAFSLDIPSDATPAFALAAGDGDGTLGGLEWKVRLAFLVSAPPRHSVDLDRAAGTASKPGKRQHATHLVPTPSDADNAAYAAGHSLSVLHARRGALEEARTEVVECDVPVTVLAGNTAFVVRPAVFTV
ncbi:Golgi membrane exchange factor (Ric1p-Rgp1p) subunit [Cryptotrichosporon argae]